MQASASDSNICTVTNTDYAALIFGVILLLLCMVLARDWQSRMLNILIACLGALLGWALQPGRVRVWWERAVWPLAAEIVTVALTSLGASSSHTA